MDVRFKDIQFNMQPDDTADIDVRMADIIDWRTYFSDPENVTVDGKPVTRTDYVHNKKVLSKFYKQHPADFIKYVENKDTAIILDLGCGQALGLEEIIGECKEYHGVDLSLEQLALSRKYYPVETYPNVKFYYDTVYSNHFPDECADFIISSEVIEHLDNPFKHIQYCRDKLKRGGILSLSTPNTSIYWYPLMILYTHVKYPGKWRKMLNAHTCWKEALSWHPSLKPNVLRKMLEKKGFTVLDHYTCTWFWFDHIIMRLTRYMERKGFTFQITLFKYWMNFLEFLIETNLPILKWAGIRQFIVAQKS